MAGIVSFGAYVPRLRLQRKAVVAAHQWYAPGLAGLGKGERASANWDEDTLTMALEAARDGLGDLDRGVITRVVLASTTHPFADRQNAGVVKEALNLRDDVSTMDVSGSQRAGTTALMDALQAADGGAGSVLCVASEMRKAAPASESELTMGDAAASLVVGAGPGVAEYLCGHSVSVDFVDHFRASGADLDYGWESRWVRDEGYATIVPNAVKAALGKAGLAATEVRRFIMPAPVRGVNAAAAKAAGIPAEAVVDPLSAVLGDAGCAQPLVILANVLETAGVGDLIVVVGFGQGCDVLIFRATGAEAPKGRLGVPGWLARRKPEENYLRYLAFRGHLALERGMRAEASQKTALTALYRNRKAVLALVGGRCVETGVVQFPKTPVSVGQNGRRVGTQEDYAFADRVARVLSYTADRLAYTPDPPGYYGAVDFDEGGRMTIEFTDVDDSDVEVGAPMRMMFRIKAFDEAQGFTKYFWKAVPDYRAAPSEARHAAE